MVGKNNPFNIRFSYSNHWIGLDEDNPETNGFCNFSDEKYGVRAACRLLMVTYRKKGIDTVYDIISRFAPTSENDTNKYIDFVTRKCGFYSSNSRLVSVSDYEKLLYAMSIYEGNRIPFERIVLVINLFNLKIK